MTAEGDARPDLRVRYREERDKRLRADGNDQYLEPTGRFAHLLEDTYTRPERRDPVREEVEVLVIGAGFAGLVTAARMRQAGIEDVRLVDKAGDVGGVWYWNRYPGAMCDTAAMIYLPLLEETGTVPSAKYVAAPEIHAHARRIARTFGLYDRALLSTGIVSVDWDEASARWNVRTDRGDDLRARWLCMGTGPLHRPKLPAVPGLETFAGPAFHTSRWDWSVTGGDPSGAPMTGLAGKRVGIIGTGATAVQCIPHLARSAGELLVFQRTPSAVDARNNAPIDPGWFAGLEPGWQRRWMENFTTLQTLGFADDDLVMDGWTDISKRIRDRMVARAAEHGIGPEAMLRAYDTLKAFPALPALRMTRVDDYYRALPRDGLPVWAGELYLQLHRGTLTSQAAIKGLNRQAEHRLLGPQLPLEVVAGRIANRAEQHRVAGPGEIDGGLRQRVAAGPE